MFTQIQNNFVLHSLRSALTHGKSARIALNFPQNLFVRWESLLLEDLFPRVANVTLE